MDARIALRDRVKSLHNLRSLLLIRLPIHQIVMIRGHGSPGTLQVHETATLVRRLACLSWVARHISCFKVTISHSLWVASHLVVAQLAVSVQCLAMSINRLSLLIKATLDTFLPIRHLHIVENMLKNTLLVRDLSLLDRHAPASDCVYLSLASQLVILWAA